MANVSVRYAEALYETENKEKYGKYLADLSTLYGNNIEFKGAIENPRVDRKTKLEIIKEIIPSDQVFINFIDLVLKENRINLIGDISAKFTDMLDREKGIIKIEIISAYELDKKQIKEISDIYKKQENANDVVVSTKIDASIIGGVKVIVDGTIYDSSLKTKLTEML